MRKLVTAIALVTAGAGVYLRLLRRPVLDWGATATEAARRMPGDDLLPDAGLVATRAITVNAPAAAIWPWLVQMGSGRGGAYTYDWIENLLGLDMHSADRIHPEWQTLEVGQVLRNGDGPGMRIEILEPERVLSSRSEDGSWVWTFELVEEAGATRLVSRNRIATGGSLVMERKMLRGIKQRAERLAAGPRPAARDSEARLAV